MAGMQVKAYPIVELEYNNFFERFNGWGFQDFKRNPDTLHKWLGVTTVMYCPIDGMVHCGLERFDNDILYIFDPKTKAFRSLNMQQHAEPYDVKVHRSLCLNTDGYIYGGTALLHDIDESGAAPGGKLFRYKPGEYEIEILGIPMPHLYIQSLVLDPKRQMLYGYTFAPERMFSYNIATGESRDLGLVGSCLFIGQAHLPGIDDAGCVWGLWGSYYSHDLLPTEGHSIQLLKYDPDADKLEYLPYGLEGPGRSSRDVIDDVVNGGDGYLYIGGRGGTFYRLDPRTAEVKSLGKPFYHQRRVSALAQGADGTIYATVGDRDCVRVVSYDRGTEKITELGIVYDPERCNPAEKIHSLTITDDGVLYGGEIDNIHRTSWLWEMTL